MMRKKDKKKTVTDALKYQKSHEKHDSFFRSEVMYLCQIHLHKESAYFCLAELGELSKVQFIPSPYLDRPENYVYILQVKASDQMEMQLKYLKKNMKEKGIIIQKLYHNQPAPTEEEIKKIENSLNNLYGELMNVSENVAVLKKNYLELIDLRQLLIQTQYLFDDTKKFHQTDLRGILTDALIAEQEEDVITIEIGNKKNQLYYYTGVMPRNKVNNFEKVLFRLCFKNCFVRTCDMFTFDDDKILNGDRIDKSLFVIFYHSESLKFKLNKICAAFQAKLYSCPSLLSERTQMRRDVEIKILDLKKILHQTEDHRYRVLISCANKIIIWESKISKYKSIYNILNQMDMNETLSLFNCEVWLPRTDLQNVIEAINKGAQNASLPAPPFLTVKQTEEVPPTYILTNRFTKGFQTLIDAYGIAMYRELNPAPYTIITFPFLFAVMFGDIGHGLLIAIFSFWMIFYEEKFLNKKKKNEIWNIIFGGRYIIFLMGLFSIYTGFIYNDLFSKGLNIFGSHWRSNFNKTDFDFSHSMLTLDPATNDYLKTPYVFGIDPVWEVATGNQIIMLNSFKMKLSIIFGVLQMLFGLIISACNHHYFKSHMSMLFEFLPQFLFLVFLFLYLVFLIFIKWIKYSADNEIPNNAGCAPSVLITFIDMMLFKISESQEEDCKTEMYPHARIIEYILAVGAFGSVPVLLVGKPIFLWIKRRRIQIEFEKELERNKKRRDQRKSLRLKSRLTRLTIAERESLFFNNSSFPEESDDMMFEASVMTFIPAILLDDPEDMTEVIITQAIHTIESILGSVSHTASYLRLWALSLAHNQLSSVLWNMVLGVGLTTKSPYGAVILYLSFGIWSTLTVSILVFMEGLSAFLHALRLHWVEFQSKFYQGIGYDFKPFHFQRFHE